MLIDARQRGRVRPQELLRVGFALDAAGAQRDGQTWDDIVRQIDPEMKSKAQRNALDPDTRARLAGGHVGWRTADPSFRPPTPDAQE
jgi:hypothetical protein